MRKYRVWFRHPNGSKYFAIIEAHNGKEAKAYLELIHPNCKATTCWLLEK